MLLGQKAVPPTLTAPPSASAAPDVAFSDVTAASGLDRFHHVSGGPAKDYIVEATGSGVALVDYDDDGWLDVYLVNGSTLPTLRAAAGALAAARRAGNVEPLTRYTSSHPSSS